MSDTHDVSVSEEKTPPSRRERRRIETRERLFEAALTLLCERDFDSVTVEMITEAADVGKGTFFNYFDNKEAVIVYYFKLIHTQLLDSLRLPPELPDGSPAEIGSRDTLLKREVLSVEPESAPVEVGGPIWKQFLTTVHRMTAIDGRNHRLARTLLALSLTNDAVRQANREIGEDIGIQAQALVQIGQQTGEFRADYEPKRLAQFVGHIYFSTLHDWAQCEDGETLETAMLRNFALAREALRPRKSEGAKNVS